MHGHSHMNAKEHDQPVPACKSLQIHTSPDTQSGVLTRAIVHDIYKRRDQEIMKLEKMRLRYMYNAHRHMNEHILFWCGIMGSFIAAWDIYHHFAKFSTGMKQISEWSGEHMITIHDAISTFQFQSYSNAFVTGYNYMIQMLSIGSSMPSGIIYLFATGLYSLSQVGAMLTAYIIFLVLLLFNILLIQVYTRGLYVYAFGTGIILRDQGNAEQQNMSHTTMNTHTESQTPQQHRYQLCNKSLPQT